MRQETEWGREGVKLFISMSNVSISCTKTLFQNSITPKKSVFKIGVISWSANADTFNLIPYGGGGRVIMA